MLLVVGAAVSAMLSHMPGEKLFDALTVNDFEPVPINTELALVSLMLFKFIAAAVAFTSVTNVANAGIKASTSPGNRVLLIG